MRRFVRGCSGLCLMAMLACGDSGSSGEPNENQNEQMSGSSENMASFDVTGMWEGMAVDEGTNLAIELELENNGGASGRELSGTLTIEGIATLTFDNSFIDPLAGAQRVFNIEASDEEGYSYTLRGTFTEKRLDRGQLVSTNPELGIDLSYLDTTLVRKP